jgi:Na+-translocating ferredoxin:NAD+ oxidoreductase RnfD subunit
MALQTDKRANWSSALLIFYFGSRRMRVVSFRIRPLYLWMGHTAAKDLLEKRTTCQPCRALNPDRRLVTSPPVHITSATSIRQNIPVPSAATPEQDVATSQGQDAIPHYLYTCTYSSPNARNWKTNICTLIYGAILLHSRHRHVSTTHVTIFRVVITQIQI